MPIVHAILTIISLFVSSFGFWIQIQPDKPEFLLAGKFTRKFGGIIGWLIYLAGFLVAGKVLLGVYHLNFLVFVLAIILFYFLTTRIAYRFEYFFYMREDKHLRLYLKLLSENKTLIRQIPSWWINSSPSWFQTEIRRLRNNEH